jgi:predicted outer membrane repeat protein
MRIKLFAFFAVFLLAFPAAGVKSRIIHVPADSSTIQAGINGAVDGDTVLVAKGRYYERINFVGKGILVASNFIFDGDITNIDSTIIDADTLVLGVNDTNSVVIFVSGEGASSVLKGFTVQNGIGTWGEGGGVYCVTSSPNIINNYLRDNYADWGGGISCFKRAHPKIVGNSIIGNTATFGGGISMEECCSPTIAKNTISTNFAYNVGGGIFCFLESSPIITENLISSNSTDDVGDGGGIACLARSSPTITGNIVMGNYAPDGGAIDCSGWSQPIIRNNTIIYNTGYFGGVRCHAASPTINSNVISHSGGGIACFFDADPKIDHNVLWKNMNGNFYDCPEGIGDTLWGVNFNGKPCDSFYNIVKDPLFVDTVSFHLLCNSPCIDAGDPNLPIAPDSGGCIVDIGAWEYPYVLGDANGDSTAGAADVVFIINYLFRNGIEPCPYHSADSNCDGLVNGADIVCLINYLFRGGDIPC